MRHLTGHESPETAYVIEDYPYGRRLRCKKRIWIETKLKKGQRLIYQTTNPKKSGEVWNKPKPSTYAALLVMILNPENDHVETRRLSAYSSLEQVEQFEKDYGAGFTAWQRNEWQFILACKR